tara:strand:- start:120 stop:392 length:273 start_codon:yes stop_codon:yes gene_type:complete
LTDNDGKLVGWLGTADDLFALFRDAIDILYGEDAQHPKMMSVGMHNKLIGHPARAIALKKILDYVMAKPGVWITRRIDIAEHWVKPTPIL